jgi:phenylalanyl-tRNA synthetase beta chain
VSIAPSPPWLAQRLLHAGVRPINNVVDISNYVMLEMGHPTHPFDADKLASDHIVVRRARPGERLETIDHVERELSEEMLVIADREKSVGVAGVMGGVGTEVEDTTTRVLLESAWFDPKGIRRTSRALKLVTDASARFQRDIDPNGASIAAERFVELLSDIDPGARPVLYADVFPHPRERRSLTFKFSEIERLLGMEIPLEESLAILTRLEFEPVTEQSEAGVLITVSIPTYRNDVHLPADLVEEVARIHGYENLPETLPFGRTAPVQRDPARLVDEVAQNALVEAGLFQVQTYTMIAEDDLVALSTLGDAIPYVLGGYPRPEEDYVRAVNPLRADWALMRPTLLPSLLKVAAENLKYNERVAIFETARTYQPRGLDKLPDERRAVVITLAGKRERFGLYHTESDQFDFFDAKGVVETLLERLGARDVQFKPVEHPTLHPRRAAAVERDGVQIGTLGELHPRVAERFGVEGRVAVAEIDLESFHATLLENWSTAPVSRFQPVRQDFAVVVEEATPAAAVAAAIQGGTGPLGASIDVFDVYRDTNIGAGKKSLAFRVTLSAPDRQLSERELERIRERIEQTVQRRVGGVLRS